MPNPFSMGPVNTIFRMLVFGSVLFIPLLATSDNSDNSASSANSDNSTVTILSNSTKQPAEQEHHYGIHVASFRFDYVKFPFILTAFILSVAVLKIVFHHLSAISAIIPESCMLILLGVGIGAIFLWSADPETLHFLIFKPKTFFLFLLPPIILEASYSLRDRAFLDNLGTILLYAVVGTILNTFLVGFGLYGVKAAGGLAGLQVSLFDCLIFSSLIAAVDPVAVLAIFQEVGVNKMLYYMVFGESLFNDAVTVVLYNLMVALKVMPHVTYGDIGLGFASFLASSIGAMLIGFIFGFMTAFVTRFTSHIRVVEPTMMFGMAYFSYLLAEMFHFSGIIGIICCGIIQAQFAMENISSKSYVTVHYFSKVASSVAESIIFIILGVMLVNDTSFWKDWNTEFSIYSLLFCFFVRLFVVLFLTFIVNRFLHGIRSISLQEQYIMIYGGLRGAVTFSLVFMLNKDSVPSKHTLLTAAYFVILFTVFIQGTTIKPLVRLLRIRLRSKDITVLQEINHGVMQNTVSGIEEIIEHFGTSYFWAVMKYLSGRFLRPLIMKYPDRKGKGILSAYQQTTLQQKASQAVVAEGTEQGDASAGEQQLLDSSALPPSFCDILLDVQDVQRQEGLRHRKLSPRPPRLYSASDPKAMIQLRNLLNNPLYRSIHYGLVDRNLRLETHDLPRFSHVAKVRRLLRQMPRTAEPFSLRAALEPTVFPLTLPAVKEETPEGELLATAPSCRTPGEQDQRWADEKIPLVSVKSAEDV